MAKENRLWIIITISSADSRSETEPDVFSVYGLRSLMCSVLQKTTRDQFVEVMEVYLNHIGFGSFGYLFVENMEINIHGNNQ